MVVATGDADSITVGAVGAGTFTGVVARPCVQPAQIRKPIMRIPDIANERRFHVMPNWLDTNADKHRRVQPAGISQIEDRVPQYIEIKEAILNKSQESIEYYLKEARPGRNSNPSRLRDRQS